MYASLFLAVVNILHFTLDRYNVFHYQKYINEGNTHFSYDSLVNQEMWWVIFSATICHASPWHLLYNLSLLLVISFEIEKEIGGFGVLVLYFSMGMVGWLFTAFFNSIRFSSGGWKYISSCGASPSTYGLIYWAVSRFPSRELPHYQSWSLLLVYVTVIAHSSLKKKRNRATELSALAVSVLIVISTLYYYIDGTLTVNTYLATYLTITFVNRLIHLKYLGGSLEYPTCDNASHLGGALWGVLLAFLIPMSPNGVHKNYLSVEVYMYIIFLMLRYLCNF